MDWSFAWQGRGTILTTAHCTCVGRIYARVGSGMHLKSHCAYPTTSRHNRLKCQLTKASRESLTVSMCHFNAHRNLPAAKLAHKRRNETLMKFIAFLVVGTIHSERHQTSVQSTLQAKWRALAGELLGIPVTSPHNLPAAIIYERCVRLVLLHLSSFQVTFRDNRFSHSFSLWAHTFIWPMLFFSWNGESKTSCQMSKGMRTLQGKAEWKGERNVHSKGRNSSR